MLKLNKVDDHLIVRLGGSARRAVAKRQVPDITAIGHTWPIYERPGKVTAWELFPVCIDNTKAYRYRRYRAACEWFGIRY